MTRELRTLLEGGAFFEGPRWRDGCWWVSDFYRHAVYRVTPDGREELELEVEGQPSGLGWLPDGSLLVVSMRDRRVLRRPPGGEPTVHADVAELCGGHLNDMVVHASGHAYVGNFGFDLMAGVSPELANLICVAPDGTATVAAGKMLFPNGSVITPDGRTLIVGETAGARYTAFDVDIGDGGALSNRRVWAQVAETPAIGTLEETISQLRFGPDGCCLDAEGCIWSADSIGQRLLRVAEGGRVVDELPAPDGLGFFACMLGGEDGRTLLICAAPGFAEHERSASREALLLTTTVDVPRAGLP